MILESCTVHELILLENNWVGWWISTWRSDFLCYRPLLKLPFMIFYILREFVNSPSKLCNCITLVLPPHLNFSLMLLRDLGIFSMWFVIPPLDDYIWVYLINYASYGDEIRFCFLYLCVYYQCKGPLR